jgi:outer membrane lipoprotein-sorting protein
MRIHVNDQIRTKTLKAEAVNGEKTKAIVEFTNPEDNGTKYLMVGDNLWIYFPEEEDVVKISGHMLKEGMMGSDVSYEDALESDALLGKYTITLAGEEEINHRPCFVISLDATVKDVPYYKRKMWVDKENFISYKQEMYAKSGKLLKVASVLEIQKIEGKYIPVKVEMVNTLREKSKTVFEMNEIVLDKPMDENKFTMRYLRR